MECSLEVTTVVHVPEEKALACNLERVFSLTAGDCETYDSAEAFCKTLPIAGANSVSATGSEAAAKFSLPKLHTDFVFIIEEGGPWENLATNCGVSANFAG